MVAIPPLATDGSLSTTLGIHESICKEMEQKFPPGLIFKASVRECLLAVGSDRSESIHLPGGWLGTAQEKIQGLVNLGPLIPREKSG